ncbi:hypothetical protein O3M35_012489 [Rhynocoris fuscipes]|uniref:Aspartate aminotransferase n=1 Tax=Rhynocoris fuscipes TaxID=488301 RepID=A0AAW1CZV8_9HEMI
MSRFDNVELGRPIEPFALNKAFILDTFSSKVNLGIGVYKTANGTFWLLPCVRKAEQILAEDDSLEHEYLPVLGYNAFCKAATNLLLGDNCKAIEEGRAFGVQALSGTGALRIAAEFLRRILNYNSVLVSLPTWENHHLLFKLAGFTNIKEYRYWNAKTRSLDLEGLLEDLEEAEENTVVVLHACAHNPTGCDPTQEQWKKIAEVMKRKKLFPLFDTAYLGFASGDVDADAWAVRYFVENEFELMCAQSFAKNFGLYNERVGNLAIILNNVKNVETVKSQMTLIIRGMYSNPPAHGAKIVALILNNLELKKDWHKCIEKMSGRIKSMRIELKNRLDKLGTPGDWHHITSQIGMFSYTGLTQRQVEHLVNKYHIYLLKSGRINMCGLNLTNIDYVANSIDETVKAIPVESVDSII